MYSNSADGQFMSKGPAIESNASQDRARVQSRQTIVFAGSVDRRALKVLERLTNRKWLGPSTAKGIALDQIEPATKDSTSLRKSTTTKREFFVPFKDRVH